MISGMDKGEMIDCLSDYVGGHRQSGAYLVTLLARRGEWLAAGVLVDWMDARACGRPHAMTHVQWWAALFDGHPGDWLQARGYRCSR